MPPNSLLLIRFFCENIARKQILNLIWLFQSHLSYPICIKHNCGISCLRLSTDSQFNNEQWICTFDARIYLSILGGWLAWTCGLVCNAFMSGSTHVIIDEKVIQYCRSLSSWLAAWLVLFNLRFNFLSQRHTAW